MSKSIAIDSYKINIVGIAADRGGFDLKEMLVGRLITHGIDVCDFGDLQQDRDDDYPDFVLPVQPLRFKQCHTGVVSQR